MWSGYSCLSLSRCHAEGGALQDVVWLRLLVAEPVSRWRRCASGCGLVTAACHWAGVALKAVRFRMWSGYNCLSLSRCRAEGGALQDVVLLQLLVTEPVLRWRRCASGCGLVTAACRWAGVALKAVRSRMWSCYSCLSLSRCCAEGGALQDVVWLQLLVTEPVSRWRRCAPGCGLVTAACRWAGVALKAVRFRMWSGYSCLSLSRCRAEGGALQDGRHHTDDADGRPPAGHQSALRHTRLHSRLLHWPAQCEAEGIAAGQGGSIRLLLAVSTRLSPVTWLWL